MAEPKEVGRAGDEARTWASEEVDVGVGEGAGTDKGAAGQSVVRTQASLGAGRALVKTLLGRPWRWSTVAR